MIDVNSFKAALDAYKGGGDRAKVYEVGSEIVNDLGLTIGAQVVREVLPVFVNASKGADNSAETERCTKQFSGTAEAWINTLNAYNRRIASGENADAEVRVIGSQWALITLWHRSLLEIERIEAGDEFGAGRGLPAPKEDGPPWATRIAAQLDLIEGKLNDILARL